jgi:phosphotransferase system HPr (HPr) family protein
VRSVEVEVRNESGLHARPAAVFVRTASTFASTLRLWNLTAGRPAVNAKSITSILSAGVEQGHVVRIEADGIDDARALDALGRLLSGLGRPVGD